MPDIPAFDPSKPFEPVGAGTAPPPFDPAKPFEPVGATKSQPPWSAALTDVPGEVGRTAAANWDAFKRNALPSELGGERHPEQEGFGEGLLKTGAAAIAPITGAVSTVFSPLRSLIGHPMARLEHEVGSLINPEAAAKDDPQQMYETAAGHVDAALAALAARHAGAARAPAAVPSPPSPGPLGVALTRGEATRDLPRIRAEQGAYRGTLGPEAQAHAKKFFDVERPPQIAAAQENITRSLDPFGQVIAESPAAAGDIASQSLSRAAAAAKEGVRSRYDYAGSLPAQVHAGPLEGLGSRIKGDLYTAAEPVIVDGKTTPQAAQMLDDIDRNLSRLRIENKADPFGPPGQVKAQKLPGDKTIDDMTFKEFSDLARSGKGRIVPDEGPAVRIKRPTVAVRGMEGMDPANPNHDIFHWDYGRNLGYSNDDIVTWFTGKKPNEQQIRAVWAELQDGMKKYGRAKFDADPGSSWRDLEPNITGVSLKGLDQARKRLVIFARDARNSGNAADARAAGRILDAFDERIEGAINEGKFSGDARAVEAWKDARAANRDYRATFSAGKGDPVGRVVERILGKGPLGPATGNDVADFLYGSSGVNPSTLNRQVALRVKSVLGERSPEWSGVKQGLFSRLIEPPGEGMTAFGHGKVAQRLDNFLTGQGREMAQAVFSAPERTLLRQYADLRRAMEIPQAGANWSNTATFVQGAINTLERATTGAIGAWLGHLFGHPLFGFLAGAGMAKKVFEPVNALANRSVLKQMPLMAERLKQYNRALAKAQRQNTPPNQAALALASSNIARTLQQLGGEANALRQLQGPGSGKAETQQQNVPGPPGEQKNGGGVSEKESFRHGGKVARIANRVQGFADGGPPDSFTHALAHPRPDALTRSLKPEMEAAATGLITGGAMGAGIGSRYGVPGVVIGGGLGAGTGAYLGYNDPRFSRYGSDWLEKDRVAHGPPAELEERARGGRIASRKARVQAIIQRELRA